MAFIRGRLYGILVLLSLTRQSLLSYRGPFPEVWGWGRTYNLVEPGSFRERHRVTCLPTWACDFYVPAHWLLCNRTHVLSNSTSMLSNHVHGCLISIKLHYGSNRRFDFQLLLVFVTTCAALKRPRLCRMAERMTVVNSDLFRLQLASQLLCSEAEVPVV